MADEWLDLADAIDLLRDQVSEARSRIGRPGGTGDVLFALGEITVELGVELTRTEGGNGGLRFGILGVGADFAGKVENADRSTHRVSVRLVPRATDGTPIDVNDVE